MDKILDTITGMLTNIITMGTHMLMTTMIMTMRMKLQPGATRTPPSRRS
jgi:hypothetical protein